ncbi:hypothetical protein STEG23_011035 [Scotinomys teguina]
MNKLALWSCIGSHSCFMCVNMMWTLKNLQCKSGRMPFPDPLYDLVQSVMQCPYSLSLEVQNHRSLTSKCTGSYLSITTNLSPKPWNCLLTTTYSQSISSLETIRSQPAPTRDPPYTTCDLKIQILVHLTGNLKLPYSPRFSGPGYTVKETCSKFLDNPLKTPDCIREIEGQYRGCISDTRQMEVYWFGVNNTS